MLTRLFCGTVQAPQTSWSLGWRAGIRASDTENPYSVGLPETFAAIVSGREIRCPRSDRFRRKPRGLLELLGALLAIGLKTM